MSDRRNQSERRKWRERGRKSVERFAVVEITNSMLHLLVRDQLPGESKNLVQSSSLKWRHHAVPLDSDEGRQELTAAFRVLADKHGLQGVPLQIVLGGKFCVTKTIRGTTEEVRSELMQLEQRSQLYLFLGPGEKVTVSRSRPIDARHEHAVAAICNENILEAVHAVTVSLGLHVESIEPSLVAISRVIGRLKDSPSEPCLLIHLDDDALELGVCHEGKLLLDYRPGGCAEAEGLVDLIRTHRSRLQRHVGRQLRMKNPTLDQIYLCGTEGAVQKVMPRLESGGEFRVERILPSNINMTCAFADGAEATATAPALGTLLSTYMNASERDAPNFMDHILATVREPLGPIFRRSIVPLAAVLFVALMLIHTNYRTQTAIDVLQEQLNGLAAVDGRARELTLQITASEEKRVHLAAFARQMKPLVAESIISKIGHCMPGDVWLSQLAISDLQTIELTGASYLEAGVFDFVQWLEQAPGFENVALRGTRPGNSATGPTTNFDLELNFDDSEAPVKEVARHE